ncbi:hypothetical protein [Burkholderia cenocepacia]|uniref:Uncharacterized protein n=1 Tax=Burkholderia cenocepacia TaxID=95486 RepID=A0A3S9NCY5_9BURK|nr:hypothetical protein [Burkholderia cenocepacia]AZQ53612.1 hypothetical protein D5R55_22080 [Burkholderia cenocepacia]
MTTFKGVNLKIYTNFAIVLMRNQIEKVGFVINFLKIIEKFFITATILASMFVSSKGFAGELGAGVDGSAFSQQKLRSLDYKSKDDIRKFMHKVDDPSPSECITKYQFCETYNGDGGGWCLYCYGICQYQGGWSPGCGGIE